VRDESWLGVAALGRVRGLAWVYNLAVAGARTYFVGQQGVLVHNKCHIVVFIEAYPDLKGIVSQVHHAIPQKVFKKWPELFDQTLKNSLENLRGIPKDGAFKLHLEKYTKNGRLSTRNLKMLE